LSQNSSLAFSGWDGEQRRRTHRRHSLTASEETA
jgi:hypothetical protein